MLSYEFQYVIDLDIQFETSFFSLQKHLSTFDLLFLNWFVFLERTYFLILLFLSRIKPVSVSAASIRILSQTETLLDKSLNFFHRVSDRKSIGGTMFLILILSAIFLQSANASSPEERAEQAAIEAKCKPLLGAGQAIYDSCIADGGRKAEVARQQEKPEEPVVCNPSGALAACEAESHRAAKMNNPNTPDIEVEDAIVVCRSACNPQSSQVLSKYLGGCGSSAKAQADQMKVYLNKCGYKVSVQDEEPEEKSLTDKFMNFLPSKDELVGLLPSKAKAIAFESGWIGGKSESTANSFANVYSVPLNEDIDYVKTVSRDGSTAYKYRSTDGSLHESYEDANSVNLSLSGPRGKVPLPMPAPRPQPPGSDDSLLGEGADDSSALATPNAEARTELAPTESPNPPPRPDDFRAPPGEGRQETATSDGRNGRNVNGNSPQDPTVREPARSPQPIVEGNDGAFVNNALNAPLPNNSGGGMSPVSVGDSSEISSGSSSSAGYASVGGGGGGGSSRVNFQGSGQQSARFTNDSPELRPASGGSASDTNINGNVASGSRGGGLGGGGDVPGVRVASARPSSPPPLDGFGFQPIKADPNSYYKTPGKTAGAASRARLVKVDPNCRGKNCKWKQLAATGNSASANCEGNPQCLLALTGPLSAKKKTSDEFFKSNKSGLKSPDRKVASQEPTTKLVSTPKCVLSGDCWTGLDAVLIHKKVIDECFQLDHAGDLEVNRSAGLQSKCGDL